ncbi:protein kinase domain protein [Ichthyophthirius multifiliis]|uniref:Protein kinase domain protein n=1 Tax=Ichthyophthirius multifiliis TaxID=5932 RepID=G0R3X1_ICHMU|nr:protein kinase domain protein [Ichthyophthirius multifiliis]EGR27847.1 protein kinase domain protein [Ichthyophthirius multifiliis]|eukprot:XP_004027192.1 protein kinase domain protein [Ichthyophthirius multifiliis]
MKKIQKNPIYQQYCQDYLNYLNEQDQKSEQEKKKSPISINSFYLLSIIGKGSYAKVSLVRKKDDNQIYALKAIKKSLIEAKNQREHVIAERNILQQVDNQYIIKMKYAFQDKKKLFFALEFCPGGELYTLLSTKKHLNEQQQNLQNIIYKKIQKRTKFYAAQMVKALQYLHSRNIIYRDLKPENILIDKDGYIKLTDFGLSKMNVTDQQTATSLCGTPEYLAPEILNRQGHGKPADWWTLGNIIYEMITSLPPFYHSNRNILFKNIREMQPQPHERIQGNLKNLLTGLLEKNSNKRLGTIDGAKQIIDHPWFADLRWDLLEKRQIVPPFIPKLDSEIDIRYIDSEFKDLPLYSPTEENAYSVEQYTSIFLIQMFIY